MNQEKGSVMIRCFTASALVLFLLCTLMNTYNINSLNRSMKKLELELTKGDLETENAT